METNNELIPEQDPNSETGLEKTFNDIEPVNETEAGTGSETLPEGRANLEICPNCLEPNDDDLAVCRYCGMPLHPGTEADPSAMPEDEKTLEQNRAEAVPEKKEKKPQESGFRRVMPWLGLYLIYYAITGCFDIKRQIQQAMEEGQQVNEKLAYLSQAIWLIAGVMMAWPLIKKGWNKIHPSPEKPEEADAAAEEISADETGTDTEAMNAEESVSEVSDSAGIDFADAEQDAGTGPESDPDGEQAEDENE